MADAFAASIIDLLPGLALGSAGEDASNHLTFEGLALGAGQDGAREIRIRKVEGASLQLASGPTRLEIGRLALHDLVGPIRMDAGRPRLCDLAAATAELSAVKLQGPLPSLEPTADPGASAWSLGPLAAAEGMIRAEIVDAHLLFDADVTVPIRQGLIDFNAATVEHVGPDSRMGVSRLGIYVDAPNGRSYLYQFPSAPVAGVAYERRGALPGPWIPDRGHLQLQPFVEALLRQALGRQGLGLGFTEQARLLFDRTALSGHVQLGDGQLGAAVLRADMVGRAEGRNAVRLHAEAVGRGLTVDMASLAVRQATLSARGMDLACQELTGALKLRLFVDGAQLHFTLDFPNVKLSGLRFHARQ